MDAPGWSCAFDEYDDNLLYCGLANNTLMVYDIRNTKSPLHKLKDSTLSALAPIHSLNIGQLNDSRTTVLCSNLKQSYVWTFESDHSVRFNPIVTNAGKSTKKKVVLLFQLKHGSRFQTISHLLQKRKTFDKSKE